MAKISTYQLKELIPHEEFDYTLLTSVLAPYAAVSQKINELLKAGVITRVKKGIYVFGSRYNRAPVCKEVLANVIYGPSCISLEYALAFHGLIPERVEALTSVTPKRDKEFKTPLGVFSYRYLSPEKYPEGIDRIWLDKRHPVLMASAEKALCDYVLLNKINLIDGRKEALAFLGEDLRVDRESWKRLDLRQLRKQARVYRSKNIDVLVGLLEAEG